MVLLKSLDLWSKIIYTSPLVSPKTLNTAAKLYSIHGEILFTTILPTLGKALDRALTGEAFNYPKGYLKRRKDRNYPVFMQEFFSRIIDKDGYIISSRSSEIRFIRTLLYLCYKMEVAFTDSQLSEATKKFVDTDSQVKCDFSNAPDLDIVSSNFRKLLPPNPFDIKCRHSSGATACGYDNIDRRDVVRFIPSLHNAYDITKFFFNADLSAAKDYYVRKPEMAQVHEPTSRVTFVPKDSRGPRTICMEPHERMYVQQGLMHKMYDYVERYSIAKGYINFRDQTINQRLAYLGSYDQRYATIDLRDASDLVSNALVQDLCDEEYRSVFHALRTPKATLPDGAVIELKKFAPMGSALCFPVEAMIFWSIARTVTSKVYVYGDDIIVDNEKFFDVVNKLEAYGLKVNNDKSLHKGFFRESCGGDYYKSHNITPIRYRRGDLVNVIAFANNLADAFGEQYGLAVIELYESIYKTIIPRLPYSYKESAALAFFVRESSSNIILFPRRWNTYLQCWEYRFLTKVTKTKKKASDTIHHLYDYYTNSLDSNSPEEDSLYQDIYDDGSMYYTIRSNVAHKTFDEGQSKRVFLTTDAVKYRWVTER